VSDRRFSAAGLLAGGAVLLASGLVGFLIHGLRGAPGSSLRVAPAAESTASRAPAHPPERRIPDDLPDFSLPGLDGTPHRLSDWRGRPLVVNFWATWCEPCRREIPLLESIHREYAKDGIEIVGIAVDYRDPVEKFARRLAIDYPVLLGDKGGLAAVQAFGMDTVLPFSVFADRAGRIVTLKVGELHRDEAELILGRLHALDEGQLTLAATREQIDAGIRHLAAVRSASAGTATQ
jgi:thiol-disulfide isomerase/thioredoxin